MLSSETILRRLSLVKYLYTLGHSQSLLPESMAFVSLLHFHDAIEIFLKLAAEKENIKTDKLSFIEYWEKIPALTLKESMHNLNVRRVNLKHRGILPAKADLEVTRVNVSDFFNQNTQLIFGLGFNDISLIDLVTLASVKNYLNQAQIALHKSDFASAITNASIAFQELLHDYEESKTDVYHRSPFFGESSFRIGFDIREIEKLDRNAARSIRGLNEDLKTLKNAFKIVGLGIDYKRYMMFRLLSPTLYRQINGTYVAADQDGNRWSQGNAQFCIDFVIESAVKVQEFDFELQHVREEVVRMNT